MNRRIANVASRRKSDNMEHFTNITTANQSGTGGTFALGPSVFIGDADSRTGFKATVYLPWAIGYDAAEHATSRANHTIFCRGYKEVIKYETSTSLPWSHRRIIFYMKHAQSAVDTLNKGYAPNFTSNGYVRYTQAFATSAVAGGTQEGLLMELLFRGKYSTDWIDPMLATVDTRSIQLVSDTTYRISSGNANGATRVRKQWVPMNHNFYYDYDEADNDPEVNSRVHATGRLGRGDMYIIDFFRAHGTATSTDQLSFRTHATNYWHEK